MWWISAGILAALALVGCGAGVSSPHASPQGQAQGLTPAQMAALRSQLGALAAAGAVQGASNGVNAPSPGDLSVPQDPIPCNPGDGYAR
jgi:hypothetical protein